MSFISRLLLQNTQYGPYMPIVSQATDNKIMRLLNDNSRLSKQKLFLKQYKSKDLDKELLKSDWRSWLLFFSIYKEALEPTSIFLLLWYILIIFTMIFYLVEVGLVLTYGQQVWFDEINNQWSFSLGIIVILIWLIDILIQINTGYLKNGIIITQRFKVIIRYIQKYLFIDIFCLLISSIVLISNVHQLNWIKLLFLFKFNRLSEINCYYSLRLSLNRYIKTLYIILKMILLIFTLSHIIGLIFYAIDKSILENEIYPPQTCWLYESLSYTPIIQLSWPLQYLYTIYWGVNTISTIAYGDIANINPIEKVYGTILFCFGFIVYGYIINQIIKAIIWSRENKAQFRNQLRIMQNYMYKMKVSQQLQRKVRKYLQYRHIQQSKRNLKVQQQVIKKLSIDLRIQLYINCYRLFYRKIENLFQPYNNIKAIMINLDQKSYHKEEKIIQQGKILNTIFYLHKGKIQLEVKHGQNITTIHKTREYDQLIGHYEFIIQKKSPYNAVCLQNSEIYVIDWKQINYAHNINLRQIYKWIQYQILIKKKITQIEHSCYFCFASHDWTNCNQRFPLIKIPQIKSNQNQINNIRIKRNNQKYEIWKEYKKIEKISKNINNIQQLCLINNRIKQIRLYLKLNDSIQVDQIYDWQYFQPNSNHNNIIKIYNEKEINQNLLQVSKKQLL